MTTPVLSEELRVVATTTVEGDRSLRHIFRRARLIVAVAVLTLLAGCATVPVTPEQLAQIQTGSQSGIIMSFAGFRGMTTANINFVNIDTNKTYTVTAFDTTNKVGLGPSMVAVPPGKYRVFSGSLSAYDATGTLPLIQHWFKPFDVAPGEVVDFGSLTIDGINLRSLPGISDQIFNMLFSLDRRDLSTYLAYSVNYSDDRRVQKMLAKQFPSLVGKPVKRPLELAFDKAQFEKVVVDAFNESVNDATPSTMTAQARVDVRISEFLAKVWANTPPASSEMPSPSPKAQKRPG